MAATAALALLSACATPTDFELTDEAQMRADIAWLADEARQGRGPGGPAEQAIRNYSIERMKAIGLQPAFPAANPSPNGARSWIQPVEMSYRTPGDTSALFHNGKQQIALDSDRFVFVGETASAHLRDAPIVFIGEAPLSRLPTAELTGTLVMMTQPHSSSEQGERIRQLRKAGALGVITIVDGRSRFGRISQRMLKPGFFLPGGDATGKVSEAPDFFTAIITEQSAVALVGLAGLDWDRLRRAARADGFVGQRLDLSANLDWQGEIERRDTANIAGRIKGTHPNSGAVLLMAHWDHLGHCSSDDGDPPPICPGAVDNASGVAAIWQIAERLTKQRHDRDIYFLLTTGEEHGFVGASQFAATPPVPLTDFVAIFNLDMLAIGSGSSDVAVIGWQGGDVVDEHIDMVLHDLGLRRVETGNFKNYLKRQDGWVFLQRGLPARMINTSFANDMLLNGFVNSAYHSPSDRYDPNMNLGSAAQDIAIHIALGRHFSDTESMPSH